MSRHRLEVYLDKVFGFSALVDALPEGREFPQHRWKKVFDAVFLSAAMQIPSLLQIEAECREGALAKRIGPSSDDTLGYALQRQWWGRSMESKSAVRLPGVAMPVGSGRFSTR